jgi:diacylglycerol kinase (ATP)
MKSKGIGPGRVIGAIRYSAHGIARLSKEPAFRQEAAASTFLLIVMLTAGVSAPLVAVGTAFLLLVLAAEAFNTAIEEIVDRVSPERSDMAKHAKDLGSAAVALIVLAAYGFCLVVTLAAMVARS